LEPPTHARWRLRVEACVAKTLGDASDFLEFQAQTVARHLDDVALAQGAIEDHLGQPVLQFPLNHPL